MVWVSHGRRSARRRWQRAAAAAAHATAARRNKEAAAAATAATPRRQRHQRRSPLLGGWRRWRSGGPRRRPQRQVFLPVPRMPIRYAFRGGKRVWLQQEYLDYCCCSQPLLRWHAAAAPPRFPWAYGEDISWRAIGGPSRLRNGWLRTACGRRTCLYGSCVWDHGHSGPRVGRGIPPCVWLSAIPGCAGMNHCAAVAGHPGPEGSGSVTSQRKAFIPTQAPRATRPFKSF
jgi:hypothetical protein